jgi:hypothetical protein
MAGVQMIVNDLVPIVNEWFEQRGAIMLKLME